MGPLEWTLATTFGISLLALVGALFVYANESVGDRALLYLVALAAGTLLGGAFLHLLPEAVADAGPDGTGWVFAVALLGFCSFALLESVFHRHHHHGERARPVDHAHRVDSTHRAERPRPQRPSDGQLPAAYLVLASDSIHNFVDGVVIAGAFLVGAPVGLVTAVAVAVHEIPQELGDFGVLVYGGFERRRALALNYASALMVVVGGVVGHLLAAPAADVLPYLVPFAAGSFVYVASADLIPELRRASDARREAFALAVFLLGVALMYALTYVE